MGMHLLRLMCWILAAAVLSLDTPLQAQEEGWVVTDKAELSFILTAGNASTSTLGLKNTLKGAGGRSVLTFEGGAIRSASTLRTRVANGTIDNFQVTETTETETTAESFFARGRYDFSISERALWFAGTGWERNTFAGIDSRVTSVTGFGSQWIDTDPFKFRTDIGATYTIQDNVAGGPTDRFGGFRLGWDLFSQVTSNSTFESKLIVDENLQDTEDLRADFLNSVTVSMSERLALKTSLQLLFDNQPSFVDVPLFTGGTPTGQTVLAELDKLDSVFTVALVISM